MKNLTKVFASIVAVLTVVLQVPAVQQGVASVLHSHPGISAAVAGITAILALVHNPSAS